MHKEAEFLQKLLPGYYMVSQTKAPQLHTSNTEYKELKAISVENE